MSKSKAKKWKADSKLQTFYKMFPKSCPTCYNDFVLSQWAEEIYKVKA